jgi:hypothetical protein
MPGASGLYWRRRLVWREIGSQGVSACERLLLQGLGVFSPQIFNEWRKAELAGHAPSSFFLAGSVPCASARSGDMRCGREGRPMALSIVLKIHVAVRLGLDQGVDWN